MVVGVNASAENERADDKTSDPKLSARMKLANSPTNSTGNKVLDPALAQAHRTGNSYLVISRPITNNIRLCFRVATGAGLGMAKVLH